MSSVVRQIDVDGQVLELRLTRKRVKNVNARLTGTELRVSAPPHVSDSDLETMVHQLARRLLRRRRKDEVNRDRRAVELARRVAAKFEVRPEVRDVIFVTTQKRRWGSYSTRTGIVRLNAVLRQMPDWVLTAVLAHELTHVVHADHSPAFWALLRSVCPETDRARAFLEGVGWTVRHWDGLPPVERSLLSGE
jgi:predicted metal-dependent hydrolase